MGILFRRRFRLPVLSRLAWAWVISVTACAAVLAFVFAAGERINGSARVALAVGNEIELLARPEPHAPQTASVLAQENFSTPPLRDGAPEEPFSVDAVDSLSADADLYADTLTIDELNIEDAGEIVITIAGSNAQKLRQTAVAVQAASLTTPAVRTAAPNSALLQKTPLGFIPKIASDGRKASDYYALPFTARGSSKRVAVIIGGLGLNAALTERAINELPPTITLAFAPYAKDLETWAARAREAGHEIMIELPMEGYGGGEALGPAALLTSRSAAENRQRLDWALARFGGYFGATNYLGGKFSADREAMAAILARLEELGVAYIDDTGAARRAMENKTNVSIVNRMIAPDIDGATMNAARRDLAALETIAARDGDALGKAYAYDGVIDAVAEWAKSLEDRDITLAPASAVLHARAGAR